MSVNDRIRHAWNAFTTNKDPTERYRTNQGAPTSYRPDRQRYYVGSEKSIVISIYNQLALDVSAIDIRHVKVDANNRYTGDIKSGLNNALSVEANIDQTGLALIQDIAMSLFDEGVVAVVPVDTTIDPTVSTAYEINTLRVGKIVEWYPTAVTVRLYNEKTGLKDDVTLPKSMVAIIENPMFAVMNEPNSMLKRLINKLQLLDAVDEQSSSGKLDLIVQLPYIVKTPARQAQADERRKNIEMQLSGSKYGIAYIDGTEKVTQLNRPAENNLMAQVTYLTAVVYNQLGLTESIFNGTADEPTMLNYFNRSIIPIVKAITTEFDRKFITKTARTQGQAVRYFRDPFKYVPVSQVAELGDKLTRNAILSSNDMRAIIGYKPSTDPKAEALSNKNLNQNETAEPTQQKTIEGSTTNEI